VLSRSASAAELRIASEGLYQVWLVLIRFIAPLAVILVFAHAIGLF
jgi:SNF family Na+-dependent transporter